LTFSASLGLIPNYGQSGFNLDFEEEENGKPLVWFVNSSKCKIITDKIIKSNGKYSLSFDTSTENDSLDYNKYCVCINVLPGSVLANKRLEIRAKVKSKIDVGILGLWLAIDNANGEKSVVESDTLTQKVSDWTELTARLDVGENPTGARFGLQFNGTGQVWIDDVVVVIDGIEISERIMREPDLDIIEKLKNYIIPLDNILTDEGDELIYHLKQSKIVSIGENTHGILNNQTIRKDLSQIIANVEPIPSYNLILEYDKWGAKSLDRYYKEYFKDTTKIKEILYTYGFWPFYTKGYLAGLSYVLSKKTFKDVVGCDIQHWNYAFAYLYDLSIKYPSININNELDSIKTSLSIIRQVSFKALSDAKLEENRQIVISNLNEIEQKIDLNPILDQSENLEAISALNHLKVNSQNNYITDRDSLMANYIIESSKDDQKSIIYAHNEHIKNTGNSFGKKLKKIYGDKYLSIGITYIDGEYLFRSDRFEIDKIRPFKGTYEFILNKISDSNYILDLNRLRQNDRNILNPLLRFLNIGAGKRHNQFMWTNLTEDFDYLVVIKKAIPDEIIKNEP
jgi:hypothetical protein